MLQVKTLMDYVVDTIRISSQYPSGWGRPNVRKGFFADDDKGLYQQIFFQELLNIGFRRTYWQLVFQQQTAGLIRRLEQPKDGMDEMHVRFYADGLITSELEHGRWSIHHWRGRREPATIQLCEILEQELTYLPSTTRSAIQAQFRDYRGGH